MTIAYYPGCSLESSSEAYDISVRAVCDRLGIEIEEVYDWNCCGATEIAAINKIEAHALVARNLALVPEETTELVAPCASCFLNLRKTNRVLETDSTVGAKVRTALAAGGLRYAPGRLKIRSLLDLFYEDVGQAGFEGRTERPLYGLRVAPYYGCQIVRPDDGGPDDPEHPVRLDEMLAWLGATVVDFPLKTHCCGGHMTQISDSVSNELIRRLLKNADDWNSDVIICLCPMCQLNLDAYQGRVNNAFNTDYEIPILFFSQLVGLALGIDPEALGFGKEIVRADRVLEEKILEAPPRVPKRRRGRNRGGGLPMPIRRRGGAS